MQRYQTLIKNLQEFVIAESNNQKARLIKKWSRPLAERISKGDAIVGLSVVSSLYDGKITLACAQNLSRFREGDFLVLHRGHPSDSEALQVVLDEDDETKIKVQLNDGDIYLLESSPDGWIADEGMLDLKDFYLEAIAQVADTEKGRKKILPLLAKDIFPTIDFHNYQIARERALEDGLNEQQAEAVGYAYGTDLAYLVQGPPGTGKTFILSYLAKMFVKDGLRVLITALTHRAINNALNHIYKLDKTLPACKIGRSERAKDLAFQNFASFYSSGFDELESGYIIGATPFATRTSRLGNIEFDVVIFDESSQITLPLALMGMLPASKYIFIGDQKQLPPITTSQSNEIARHSIFEYLCKRGFDTMLTTTYRLNQELVAWPSRTFYEGKIQPSESAKYKKFSHEVNNSHWQKVLNPDHSAIFIDLGHRNTTVKSQEEAEVICEIIADLLEAEYPPAEIGVVVPYRIQARLIRNELRKYLQEKSQQQNLIVDTVERMQGQEKETVFLSLTTSNAAFASQLGEFFFQPQGLNVAVTRPRTKLIILGSCHLLEATSDNPKISQWINMFSDLISSCKQINIGDISL